MKKKAILYIRVSTDEQAEKGFSLPAQQIKLEKYCNAHNIEVLKVFQDDYSAWEGFDRPGYKKLREYVAGNKKDINYLLVTQWSRFSRNMTASLNEIERLNSITIEVNAVEQWIDFKIPESKYMLAMYLVAPQVENDRLSIRTKDGMRQAVKQGKWLWHAPVGYKNNKITKLMEINEEVAPIVKWCFDEYAKGIYTAEEVRSRAKEFGLKMVKQSFLNMLSNPIYKGYIILKADGNEPEQLIKGLHDPLVDEYTFAKVQSILKGKSKPNKIPKGEIQDAVYLRGLLLCPCCGRNLTGGYSKGNGGKYPYYHCQTKYRCKVNFNADIAHNSMADYLQTFEPRTEIIYLFKEVLADIFYSKNTEGNNQKQGIEQNIRKIEEHINKVENDYLEDRISANIYSGFIKKLEGKKEELTILKNTVSNVSADLIEYVNYSASLMENLKYYYENSHPSTKSKIVGLIFPEKLTFTGNEYRTTKINEVFTLICSLGKGLKENSLAKNARLSTWAPPAGLEPATL